MKRFPQRLVCLSAESADWLWRIGAWDQVVGVTAYFEPPDGIEPKPKISGFSSANLNAITQLNPDLVITFSDVQAGLAETLIRNGLNVLATNQRTLKEIGSTLAMIACAVGKEERGGELLEELDQRLRPVPEPARRPRVYFEEWNDPLVTGIAWVGELIERAGGLDVFAGKRPHRAAADRAVSSGEVIEADPEVIFASWCGKPVDIDTIANRPGWDGIPAIRNGRIHEIPSNDVLQPGFRLVNGFEQLKRILRKSETTGQAGG